MAEAQPPTVVEGATTGDVDDEIPVTAKSAEDRKAAAALSSLDAREDESLGKDVDTEAVKKAMERLGGAEATNKTVKKADEEKVIRKAVKVDQGDVTLLIDELELTKAKATELLKAHEGSAEKALRAYITPAA
ncbi:hypothetical protein QTJ16_007113 [Diplocarpon rosae]|uniref:Nascent polypeptide-associated complex subunit alpha-like UBA domain-containing protein n=1 Tax=Diplocarpon rosae TaxID=946125 RepID=A0AAD9SV82_9HELO|nr:hypothetical protein QTJ16_007113 [Diplocarpon rosae]PBP26326.1 hypothetical protein BUE80_DR002574 [Diplocarpon rosae]